MNIEGNTASETIVFNEFVERELFVRKVR